MQLGNWEKALADYQSLVRYSQRSGQGYLGLGDCLSKLERTKEAIESYTRAVNLDSSLEEVGLYKRALLQYKHSSFKGSLEDFERVSAAILYTR